MYILDESESGEKDLSDSPLRVVADGGGGGDETVGGGDGVSQAAFSLSAVFKTLAQIQDGFLLNSISTNGVEGGVAG